jgi:hypothetical protein
MYVTLNQKVNIRDQNAGNLVYYSPSEIRGAYNATALLNAGYTGRDVTISIVDAYGDPYIQSELDTFSAAFGIPSTTVHVACVDGPCNYTEGIAQGWNDEIALDVEWAHAMAPGATVNLYIGSNAGQALYDAVAAAVAGTNGNGTFLSPSSIVSMSWGTPENDIGESGSVAQYYGENYPWLDAVFQQGAAQGITFFASTGDAGAYDQGSPYFQDVAYGSVNYPASDPFVTAVGGTSLYLRTTSGYLQFPMANATAAYGAETAWSYSDLYDWGTGGGYSSLFAQPSWQNGPGVTSGEMRGVPDVSWDADVQTGVVVYVAGNFQIFGGTSVGSPSWAGAMALIDQEAGHPLGFVNPSIYSILNNPAEYAKAFHDATAGDNDPYQAGPGWDPTTGVGSPNIGELATFLSQPTHSLKVSSSSSVILRTSASYDSAVFIYAQVLNASTPVTTGTVTASLTSDDGSQISSISLTYNSTRAEWVGDYTIAPGDPSGMWTATVIAASGSWSGIGSSSFSVGDGVTIGGSWGSFMVGNTIPVSAVILAPNSATNITAGTFTATFYLSAIGETVEGVVPLAYNATDGMWQGSLTVTPSMTQGVWVMSIGGVDSSGERAAQAYTWLNIGLQAAVGTNSDTYVVGQTIGILSVIGNTQQQYQPATGTFSAGIWVNGVLKGTVPLTFELVFGFLPVWAGFFSTSAISSPGFYNIVVTGNDANGNMAYGETLVRVAPAVLSVSVQLSLSAVVVNSTQTETANARITYGNGTVVKVGSVDGFVSNGQYFPMTFNSASMNFTGIVPAPSVIGSYNLTVVAFDPWGSTGEGIAFFSAFGVTVQCTPGTVGVGTRTTCTAQVGGPVPPTGKVEWSAQGAGKFTRSSCKLTRQACLVAFTPTTAGAVIVTGSYLGDPHNVPSFGTFTLNVTQAASTTLVRCSPASLPVGSTKTVRCTATVKGYSPTGKVAWSQTGIGSLSFTSATCTLTNDRCSVSATELSAGPVVVRASYAGDTNNLVSLATAGVTVQQLRTSVSISCASTAKNAWTCTATLKGYYGSVAGESVTWSRTPTSVGTVSFSSLACALSAGTTGASCQVAVTGTSPGKVTLTAAFGGDASNTSSQRNKSLKVS